MDFFTNFYVDWSQFGAVTLVVCSTYAIVGAFVTDALLGSRAFGHFLNYLFCLACAYLGNVLAIVSGLYLGDEVYRAIIAASIGMTIGFLGVLFVRR